MSSDALYECPRINILPFQFASDMQMFPSAAPGITCNPNDGTCRDHITFTNGNFGEVAVADGNVTMTKRDEDAGTLVVADFVNDAMQHDEDFVVASM